jgi:hypothetical protein
VIIERRIITGLIVSADFLRRVAPFWSDDLIEAPEFRRIARWCLDHFDAYNCAPDRNIETIFFDSLKAEGIPKAEAELIEGVLSAVSDDYERGEQFNSAYLYDQTVKFFRERELAQHNERVSDLIERGQLADAEALASAFRPRSWATTRGLDLGTEAGYAAVRAAFEQASEPILRYPGALGAMLNRHLIRGGFISLEGPEKRGKTFWLTDIAFRGLRQKCNVAFFQAGDLTESQYLRRMAVHLARCSDDPEYSRAHWRPVGDCARNQFDLCRRSDRNCDRGIYDRSDYEAFKEDPNEFQQLSELVELAGASLDYAPCASATCDERWPVVWMESVLEREPLSGERAAGVVRAFFERYRRRFRLATYPNGTLTTDEMRACLDEWERDGFVPDIVATDYADIMSAPDREYRHRQNAIWMGLRGISQERHALVVTGTQTDAASYRSELLGMGNFTEDKRKRGHVTASFGLNQDPHGREKALGIMRINTIVAREGDFNPTRVVTVLQDLASGRPFVGSFRAGSARTPVPRRSPKIDKKSSRG